MKISRSTMFTNDPRALRWLTEIVDYISASYANPVLWEVVQSVAKTRHDSRFKFLQEKASMEGKSINELPIEYRSLPLENEQPSVFFSIGFYLSLSAEMERNRGGDDAGGSLHPVGEAFQLLIDAGVLVIPYAIYKRDSSVYINDINGQAYRANEYFAKYLISNNLIYNHLFGFDYIISKYSKSVVKIEVKHEQDIFLGTGWVYDVMTMSSEDPLRLVITNDHVIKGASAIKVMNKSDEIITHYEVEGLQESSGFDIAVLRIDYNESMPAFMLHHTVPLLEEVITIGYPSVPLSKASYQLVHRGEVNAQVTDYYGQDLLVISSRTAPGSSGSPVIDDTGRVVGIVAQQLFEKAAFEQKGITPYSACIPAVAIEKAIRQAKIYKNRRSV